jgi:hypothetical protein
MGDITKLTKNNSTSDETSGDNQRSNRQTRPTGRRISSLEIINQ